MTESLILKTDPRPFVLQIQERLRARIRSGELKPGQRIPSMRQFAEQSGASLGIVKQALTTLATEGFLRSHPGRGVYVAESQGTQRGVALVLPALDTEQAMKVVKGVKTGLGVGSARLLVMAADFDFQKESDLFQSLNASFIAGAIIVPPPVNRYVEPLRDLRRAGIPFVLADTVPESLEADSVQTDRVQMGRMAFGYLLERGHRRIGVVDHSGDSLSHRELREGADEALRKAGQCFALLPRVVTDVTDLQPKTPWINGERASRELLDKHPGLTAIVGMNDNLSLGVLRGARASGRSVPDDLSVLAIGDLSSFVASDPPLTAIHQPHEAMGFEAARRLVELLDAAGLLPVQRLQLSPQLVERASVKVLGPNARSDTRKDRRGAGRNVMPAVVTA